jgi:hypothetical protein
MDASVRSGPTERCAVIIVLQNLPRLIFVCMLWATTAYAESNPAAPVQAPAKLPRWSGIWQSAVWPTDVSGRVPGGENQLRNTLQLSRHPPFNATSEARYAASLQNQAALEATFATFKICTRGFPSMMESPALFQIAVLPEETLLIFENQEVRHVYTDGRQHPPPDDVWPTRWGDSIGHWEGDTLVIDTIARKAGPITHRAPMTILSEQTHFTERLRKVNDDRLEDQLTIEDPLTLARPWQMTLAFNRVKGAGRLLPYDCTENDRNPIIEGKMTISPSH